METLVTNFGAAMVVMAAIAAVCFVAYLIFLGFVIVKTGSTEGLRDVAQAISAYKVPLGSRIGTRIGRGARGRAP